MQQPAIRYKSGAQLSLLSTLFWRALQTVFWLIGAAIFYCLVFYPDLGVILFWNILIPIAPALIVVAVGLWRNVCPLATTTLLPRHLGLSKRKKMSISLQGKLGLVAVISLYAIVPLRHSLFNVSGYATAALLFVATSVGLSMGFIYEWKSAWCSSLCPVHPVEKLYGGNVMFALPNAHCDQCQRCVIPCPDSTPNVQPNTSQRTVYHRLSGILMVGGLPGFIWGWFHIPDHYDVLTLPAILEIYTLPLSSLLVTLGSFWLLTLVFDKKGKSLITAIFAAASVSCYYWYRIPSLFGYGKFPDDGLLINLTGSIPYEAIFFTILATTAFFFWWIVIRKPNRSSWVIRPAYGEKMVHHAKRHTVDR